MNHFPATIPPSAQDARFFARPDRMQGDLEIQLHLKLPADQVAAIEASARSIARRIYPGGGDESDHVNADRKHGWPTATFHTAADPSQFTFPQTYTFYVIKAVDQGMGTWDGCDVCGIAISASTNEVVYWAEWSGMPPATTRPIPARVATTRPSTSRPDTMPDAGEAGGTAGR